MGIPWPLLNRCLRCCFLHYGYSIFERGILPAIIDICFNSYTGYTNTGYMTIVIYLQKGFTPLHIAAKHGHIKVVQLLLKKGMDPDAKGRNDLTPLHVATHYGHPDIALYLLDRGANALSTTKVRSSNNIP